MDRMISFAKTQAFQKTAVFAFVFSVATWQLGFKEALSWFAAMAAWMTPVLIGALLAHHLLRRTSVPLGELFKWIAIFTGSLAFLGTLGSFSLFASRWEFLVISLAIGIAVSAYNILIGRKKS